ncbi:MAG: DUF4232 domain-containing protein [Acidobacteria bacterium]|nr:DUF4232 domain-containing protein [Acidobacteriota bacterium]
MNRALKMLGMAVLVVVLVLVGRHLLNSKTTTTTLLPSTTSTVPTAKPVSVACKGSDFSGVYNQGQGAAGTIFASVTLTKVTPGTCTFKGYPLLTLQDKTGAVITSKQLDTSPVQFPDALANKAPSQLSLSDGATTTFSLGYSDVPVGTQACASATTLSVQFAPGGSVVTVTPAYPVQPCNDNTVWVSPFY